MGWVGDSSMIRLDEVAKKIQDILNGTDAEVIANNPSLNLPTPFAFVVNTEGYHLDHNIEIETGKNFIPVFISSMGGNFNPVPELMQANYVIPITFYFPVRFKNEAYKLNEYLARVFVGKQLNYGENSGIALSNISVAQYGEIVDLDLKQFAEWVRTNYKQPIEKMEPYIQMSFSLYLSTVAEGFVYGNDASATLTLNDSDYEAEPLTFVQSSVQSNSDPAPQQVLGENETEALPTGTSYGSSFSVYVKNDPFFQKIIEEWFAGNAQALTFTLSLSFLGKTFTRICFIQSVNLVLQRGELVTITFTFTKKASVVDGL